LVGWAKAHRAVPTIWPDRFRKPVGTLRFAHPTALSFVIPGRRASGEPGIHFTTHVVEWIPDSRSRGFRNDELLFVE